MPTYTLSSPNFSFVQVYLNGVLPANNTCCQDEFCLPVTAEGDVNFQFISTQDTFENTTALIESATLPELHILPGTGNTDLSNSVLNLSGTLEFEKNRTGQLEVTFGWSNPLTGLFTHIPIGGCFQLGIDFGFGGIVVITNCFVRKAPSCYLNILKYYSDDDCYGFRYCNMPDFENRVRLPMFLNKPQVSDDEQVYIKSNTSRKILSSTSSLEWEVAVDFMPKEMHFNLKMALSHDSVAVEDPNYSGGISKNGQYKIEWDEPTDCQAPGSAKVFATPFAARNSNCDDCQEFSDLRPCAQPLTFSIDTLTSTSVSISWTNPAGSDPSHGYFWVMERVEVGGNVQVASANPGTSPAQNNPSFPLTSGTDYILYVTANCGGGIGGSRLTSITFTTP